MKVVTAVLNALGFVLNVVDNDTFTITDAIGIVLRVCDGYVVDIEDRWVRAVDALANEHGQDVRDHIVRVVDTYNYLESINEKYTGVNSWSINRGKLTALGIYNNITELRMNTRDLSKEGMEKLFKQLHNVIEFRDRDNYFTKSK